MPLRPPSADAGFTGEAAGTATRMAMRLASRAAVRFASPKSGAADSPERLGEFYAGLALRMVMETGGQDLRREER